MALQIGEFIYIQFYPGGKELASTKSDASFSTSSLAWCKGVRGRAISPVRADSKMPKSEMSRRKESMRVGLADLGGFKGGLIS